MSDPNAPSWLTAVVPPPPLAQAATSAATEKPAKSGGVFNMFSKEAATAHVQKAAVNHATNQAQNLTNAPDDGFTPAWATAKAYTPPRDVENGGGAAVAASSEASGPAPLDLDPELMKRMRFYHTILRVAYMVAAIVMSAAAALSLIAQTNVSAAFFAIYVLFFCLIMCCFEVGLNVSLKHLHTFLAILTPDSLTLSSFFLCFFSQFISSFIAINFGFLYTLTGRIIFLLFVGFMSYSLSIFGKAAMALLYLVGFIHALIMCKFPKFSEYVRQKDFYGSRGKR